MRASEKGIALVITLLAIAFVSALGLALVLSSSIDRMAAANHDEAVALLNAADAALELAVRELAPISDWSAVLAGSTQSTVVDGPPVGIRTPSPGISVNLTALTNELSCGRATGCTAADVRSSTSERPWGPNNPFWRPFLHASLSAVTDPRHRVAPYVVVWIGDDAREIDGDSAQDGGGSSDEGRYLVRARAEAFGARGARRAIEAELARVCAAPRSCLPGVRVQSWRLVTATSP